MNALEAELLGAIRARPDEDAPRLVYADYLTEQGDLRGRFIADQVALARLPETDPRWSALYARTERLRHRHGSAWLEALGLAGLRVKPEYHRGLVERVSGEVDAGSLRALAAQTPLRSVSLPASTDLLALGDELGLGLTLVSEPPRSSLPDWLDQQPASVRARVVRLELSLSTLSRSGSSALRKLPALRELAVKEASYWTMPDCAPLIEAGLLDGLEVLELRTRAPFTPFLPALFARRSASPVRLLLEQYAHLPAAVARALRRWRPLRALAVSGFEGHETNAFLQDELVQEHLEHLSVARTLAKTELPGLRSRGWARLSRLWCDAEGSALLRELARAPVLSQLVELSAPSADDHAVMALLSSPHPTRLVSLSVGELRNRTLTALAGWPGLAHVLSLSFSRSEPVNQATLQALLRSPHLDPVLLALRGQALTPSQLDELRERFPGAVLQR